MPELNQLFKVSYGNKFDYNKMISLTASKINFVGRTEKNNGVVGKVELFNDVEPYSPNLITVALGGSILSSFVQTHEFYTAQNVAVLEPLFKMTHEELLFYCTCIEKNRYKYSAFGREANVTLAKLDVPDINMVRSKTEKFNLREYGKNILKQIEFTNEMNFYQDSEKLVPLKKLFLPKNGITTSGIEIAEYAFENSLPMLRPSYKQLTSIAGYIEMHLVPADKIFPQETLYVSTNGQGSHTYSYVSAFEFTANSDVTVLLPKRNMSLQEKIFYSLCITKNRYKFSYGRKPKGDKLMELLVPEFPPKKLLEMNIAEMLDGFINSVTEL